VTSEEATTPELVERTRRIFEADRRDSDAIMQFFAPDAVWEVRGAAESSSVWPPFPASTTWDTWERFEFEESEMRDLGDSVLCLGRVKMRGSASQVELDQEFAVHGLVRDGKLIRVLTFLSWQEALGAVGLAG
jgi:ketosteroid isomerase-like protein